MENVPYSSAYYGNLTIRAKATVHSKLDHATVEKLAELLNGADEKAHLKPRSRGNPGDGAETFVHDQRTNKIASVKDIHVPPGTLTVLNTGKAEGDVHVWD